MNESYQAQPVIVGKLTSTRTFTVGGGTDIVDRYDVNANAMAASYVPITLQNNLAEKLNSLGICPQILPAQVGVTVVVQGLANTAALIGSMLCTACAMWEETKQSITSSLDLSDKDKTSNMEEFDRLLALSLTSAQDTVTKTDMLNSLIKMSEFIYETCDSESVVTIASPFIKAVNELLIKFNSVADDDIKGKEAGALAYEAVKMFNLAQIEEFDEDSFEEEDRDPDEDYEDNDTTEESEGN